MGKKKTSWVDDWIKACESPAGQVFAAAIKVAEKEKELEEKTQK